MEREQILEMLEKQFKADYAGNGYKDDFTPDGCMTECNFGGKLVILGNSGESVLVWSDWSDNALSTELTECEIVYEFDSNNDMPDTDDGNTVAGFYFEETFYSLGDFMRINY